MGRTKGSKNGVSTTPGYVAIGKRAQKLDPTGQRFRNWQAWANRQAAINSLPSGTRMYLTKRQNQIRAQKEGKVDIRNDARMYASPELLKKLANERKANVSKNAEDINKQISAHRSRLQEIVANKMNNDRKAKVMKQQIKKAVNIGAQNNWQQQAAGAAAGGMTGQAMRERRIHSVRGLNAAGWDEHDRRVHGKSLGDYMKKAAEAYEAKVKYNKDKKKRKKKTLIIE